MPQESGKNWQSDSRTSTITDSCSRCNNSVKDAYLQGLTIHSKTRSDLPGTPPLAPNWPSHAVTPTPGRCFVLFICYKNTCLSYDWWLWSPRNYSPSFIFRGPRGITYPTENGWWLLASHLLEAQHHWRILWPTMGQPNFRFFKSHIPSRSPWH